MKVSADLVAKSPQGWIEAVLTDFDAFLQDHADCERKASAMAMSMVAKFPDRLEIIPQLIETAVEELEHFRDVYALMEKRNLTLPAGMSPDPYVSDLLKCMKSDREGRFLDRLLVASVVECRGAERFRVVFENLPKGDLRDFYHRLWASEAKHGEIFVRMALLYFPEKQVYDRLSFFVKEEARIMEALPFRAALH